MHASNEKNMFVGRLVLAECRAIYFIGRNANQIR